MKFSLYNKKNQLDEMQEKTLLNIEARGFWLLWSSLLAAILLQILFHAPAAQFMGEFVVFMAGCAYIVIRCLHNGLWDRHIIANTTTNVVGALFAGAAVTVITGLANGYWLWAIIPGIITAIFCFVILQVSMHATQKRREELDNPTDDPDDPE